MGRQDVVGEYLASSALAGGSGVLFHVLCIQSPGSLWWLPSSVLRTQKAGGKTPSWLPHSVKPFTSVGMASRQLPHLSSPASPFRAAWKPGYSPPPHAVRERWVPLEMNPEAFWGHLHWGCSEKRWWWGERRQQWGGFSKIPEAELPLWGRGWCTWKLLARLYCSSKISTALPAISSRDVDVHLMFPFQQNKCRLGPCSSCD